MSKVPNDTFTTSIMKKCVEILAKDGHFEGVKEFLKEKYKKKNNKKCS